MDSESLLSPLGHYRVLTVDRLHAALSLLIDRGYGDMPVTIALDDEDSDLLATLLAEHAATSAEEN